LDPAARQGDGLTRCPRLERNVHGPIALLEAEGQDVVIAAYRASVIHDLLGSLLGDGLDPASEPVHGRRLYCRAASTHTAAMMDAAITQMRTRFSAGLMPPFPSCPWRTCSPRPSGAMRRPAASGFCAPGPCVRRCAG